MNEVLEKVVDLIDEEIFFVVFGDYGMDDKGNYGGDLEMEILFVFWFYFKGFMLINFVVV